MKVDGQKNIFHVNGNQKIVGLAIFIKNKIDFKSNIVTWDNKEYYIMIKYIKYIYIYLPVHQKDITIINVCMLWCMYPTSKHTNIQSKY